MVSEPERIASLCKLFQRHKDLEEKFQQFRAHSYTTDAKFKDGQSSTQCKKATLVGCPYGCGTAILFAESIRVNC